MGQNRLLMSTRYHSFNITINQDYIKLFLRDKKDFFILLKKKSNLMIFSPLLGVIGSLHGLDVGPKWLNWVHKVPQANF